jgi:hypothetical protein
MGGLDALLEMDEIGLGCRLDCSGQVKLHRNTDLHALTLLGLWCQGKMRERFLLGVLKKVLC